MKLNDLLENVKVENEIDQASLNLEISGLTDDSTQVEKGCAFIAIKGYQSDGHLFIEDAIERGAAVIIGGKQLKDNFPVPYVQVANSRKALGQLSAVFYNYPSRKKILIGITGTNGKTTTSYMVRHIFESTGYSCSLIGTIQNVINGEKYKTINTTPSSLVINQLLNKSTDDIVIMEASSQGLSEFRLEGIEFDACLFTNLSPEHLDYHGSLENYFEAKKKLFLKLKENGTALINYDDEFGERLAEELSSSGVNVRTFGQSKGADHQIKDLKPSPPSNAVINDQGEWYKLPSPIAGFHNLYNSALSYITGRSFSLPPAFIIKSIESFPGVEGRFNIYKLNNGASVVIDYAHTAEAILNCLQTALDSTENRLIHIFGFRGNRDEEKRKEMVRISAEISDSYILTLDDLNEVSYSDMVDATYKLQKNYGNEKGRVIPDRTSAIEEALSMSKHGDWIIITGKGHEKYQQEYRHPVRSDKDAIQYLSGQTNR
ncbi:UDP-N-acetylmuramoyl-L-alanyl-D-glutamate--2,6-diaminopimelate ligase [Halobacillus sp. Marseille-Q1614]|uniref:UDP-N-acetylmuramoyl-L-alanyl-D-glutamate--2, 6-diaminopimelate ligase n=1 Tax=Halobacillus sp. Marseille-Q1614 TaxID=2709134 RepID=UPI00156FD8DB|nr:UDP-N-acetylmuramoyl-L-alanyl-D-glutamate--2,6-diaminopimelate ligase [Halobacillus sp. Marseille-Q1614]